MAYSVPPLPYAYDALEPHIDKLTMEIHHDKHHQAYVDKVNAALEGTPLADAPIEDVLKDLSQVPEDKAHRRAQQRRRPLQPQLVLGVDVRGRRRRARRRAGRGDRLDVRLVLRLPGKAQGNGHQPVRLRLVLARARRLGPGGCGHAEPGQPDLYRQHPAAGCRRVGARLLPEVPEQAPRLPRRLVEHGRLGEGRRALQRGG